MKRTISMMLALAVVLLFAAWTQSDAYSQAAEKQQGKGGMQQRGVGMFDDDGDGIPNGQDPDFTRPRDGTGKKLGRMNHGGRGAIGSGSCLGSGARGNGPRDGSGPRGQIGLCDGTGPKGQGRAAK